MEVGYQTSALSPQKRYQKH